MNDRQIAALKPTVQRQEISLPKQGLYLVVQPTGTKTFQFRPRINGKLVRRKLGTYPLMTMRQANAMADKLRGELESARITGEAPKSPLLEVSPKVAPKTFSQAWALYMEHEGEKRATAKERWRIFRVDLEPHLGTKLLHEVTRDDVEVLLYDKARTAPVASNTIFILLSRFFRWCKTKGHRLTRLDHSPMDNVAKVGSDGTPRDRHLTDREIGWFFDALPEAGIYQKGLEALLYTGQRREAVFGATKGQLEDDLLTIKLKDPKDRPPLFTYVWFHPEVMKLIPRATKKSSPEDRLFEGRVDSLNKAAKRVADRMTELAAQQGETCAHWSPHDLRRTMATWLSEQTDEDEEPRFSRDTVERCLSHIDGSVAGKHYVKSHFLKSKKRAWEAWGDHLKSISTSRKR